MNDRAGVEMLWSVLKGMLGRGACLACIFMVVGCREQLMHNLSEQQANRLMTRLDDNQIDSNKIRQPDGRWSVEVERSHLPDALREMQKLRLLRDTRPGSTESSSVIASRDQQRFAFERALSTEIEQTLLSVDGVLEARVHLNLPQVDPLFGKSVPGIQGSGSVFIIAEQQLGFSREEVAALVGGAAGMSAQGISVLIEVDQAPQAAPAMAAEVGGEKDPIESEPVPADFYLWQLIFGSNKSVPLLAGLMLVVFGAYLVRLILNQSKIKRGVV